MTSLQEGILGKEIWRKKRGQTAGYKYRWRKMEAAAQDRAGWRDKLSVTYVPPGETIHKSSQTEIRCRVNCIDLSNRLCCVKLGFVKASELTPLTLNHKSLRDVLEQLKRTPAGLDALLAKMIPCGVAFHHAGKLIPIIVPCDRINTKSTLKFSVS